MQLRFGKLKLRPAMATKQRLSLEIKEISAEGYFEGMLSPYGNVDEGNDVVEAGAYTKTLQEQGNTRPLLWQHDPATPIGLLTLEDRPNGLWCKGQLLIDDPHAQRAYRYIKARIVKGLSIGFESVKDAIENGVRKLKELKLYEGSIVTFPMNTLALISAVKGLGLGGTNDFTEELTEVQLWDACDQMMSALYGSLRAVRWSDLEKDDQIAASQTICEQFTEAYMAFLPAYCDMITEQYGGMELYQRQALETKMGLRRLRKELGAIERKGAIAVHHTSVDKDGAWDAGAALKNLGDKPSEANLRKLHAWVDPDGNPETKAAYKLPHHDVSDSGSVGSANMKGVESAMGRLNGGGLDIPEADRKGVHAHLAAHYKDAGMDAPELKQSPGIEQKAGKTHSAATVAQYKAMAEHVMSMGECTKNLGDIVDALLEEAGEASDSDDSATPDSSKAAHPAGEPGSAHSTAASLIEGIRTLIPSGN